MAAQQPYPACLSRHPMQRRDCLIFKRAGCLLNSAYAMHREDTGRAPVQNGPTHV